MTPEMEEANENAVPNPPAPSFPTENQEYSTMSHTQDGPTTVEGCEPSNWNQENVESNHQITASSRSIRKPVPISKIDSSEGAFVQRSPSSTVFVQPPSDGPQPEPFSVLVEDHASQRSSMRSPPAQARLSQDRSGTAGSLQMPLVHAEGGLESFTFNTSTDQVNTDGEMQESIDPSRFSLQHDRLQPRVERVSNLSDRRVSQLTVQSTHSDASSNSGVNVNNDYLAAPSTPNNRHAGSLPRNLSVCSSTSDLGRGRNRSPWRSPGSGDGGARASSAHSLGAPSPDQRPLSYVDLLNVPYPQAPPVSADRLYDSHLRTAAGNNASQLSIWQTLEMYRANVKKSKEPGVQYEFAVLMVGAAQELPAELAKGSSMPSHRKSTPNDLLKEARQILQKLSDRSYPFAQYYLADGYFSGLFNKGKEDYDKAFPLFLAASKHGHAEAAYRTALCYEFGWGCRVDGTKATQFFRHAASKNHPGAMLRLGRTCLTGEMGQPKRYREGVKWLKRAAESADFQYNCAPYELALLHVTGHGDDIFRDEAYAVQLFTKSADLGHAESNFRLGAAYEHGLLGCPRDPALSVHFYTGAAEQSHALSMMALCAWYMLGAEPVLEKDENEAYAWASKAADLGLPRAAYTIGFFTEIGIGCRKDALEANVWYVRAADQGDEKSIHRIAAIRAASTGTDPVVAALPKEDVADRVQNQSRGNTERG